MRDWIATRFDQLQHDVRYALRGLRRAPAFTATVILTLGLGIGANAVMFTVVDRLMFRPHAYLRDPGTAHRIYWQWHERGATTTSMSTQYARYLDLRKWTTSFSHFAGLSERDLAVGSGMAARERRVAAVSASYFDFFAARPVLGRFFTAGEDVTPRGADVAVLSHAFWQSEYGGRDVRGEVLQVGEVSAAIIGVAPPGFAGLNDAQPPVLWIPITTFAGSGSSSDARTYFTRYQWGWMHVLVRRRPEVTLAQAEADASQAFRRSWEAGRADDPSNPPTASANPHAVVSALRPGAGPDPSLEARTAVWVMVVAAIVLLIACSNVANLFLARALRRRRETALRLALGVSRRRLLTQWLTESLALALIAGCAALLTARWAGAALRAAGLNDLSRLLVQADSRAMFGDWRVIGVTAGLALATGLFVGLVPAFWSGRGDLARSLRGGVRGGVSEGRRVRSALLVVQSTMSVVLLIGAALFVRSLQSVKSLRMGYDVDRVLLVYRVLRGPVFNDSAQREMRRILLTTAQSLPSVESAAWASSAPFVSTSNTQLFVPGIDSVARLGTFTFQATTSDYFRTMGTRILRGRALTAADRAGAPNAAVVSASMARVLWPGQDALGKCFRMRSDTVPCTTVVGIAEDMVQRDLTGPQRYHYYVSIDQYTRSWGNWMLLRLRVDPVHEAQNVRSALQRAMPGTSYVTVQPLRTVVHSAQNSWRMGATMFLAFGLLALVVAAVGLYGVIAYGVTERMHEWGVRRALGAQSRDIVGLVAAQSAWLAALGVALGITVALLASRWIQPLLFQQSARDARVYAAISLLLIVVALFAGALPALRAARVHPNAALKAE